MGGFSLWHWLVVLVIVVLVFGTKRLKNVGQDLGEAVRGFKKGLHEDDAAQRKPEAIAAPDRLEAAGRRDHPDRRRPRRRRPPRPAGRALSARPRAG